jgi:hypothetical protein
MRVYMKIVIIMGLEFATSKNLVVKSKLFPHRNIHKYTWTSPDGKTHNYVDLSGKLTVILIIIWWLQNFGKECRQRNKQQKSDVERFNIKRLSEMEVRKQFGELK